MTFDPYELAVRLRTLLDVTDCSSVLLTHSNGTVFQATRGGELTILADERVAFDPDEARYGLGEVPEGAFDIATTTEEPSHA